jgi:hypothetical protein
MNPRDQFLVRQIRQPRDCHAVAASHVCSALASEIFVVTRSSVHCDFVYLRVINICDHGRSKTCGTHPIFRNSRTAMCTTSSMTISVIGEASMEKNSTGAGTNGADIKNYLFEHCAAEASSDCKYTSSPSSAPSTLADMSTLPAPETFKRKGMSSPLHSQRKKGPVWQTSSFKPVDNSYNYTLLQLMDPQSLNFQDQEGIDSEFVKI